MGILADLKKKSILERKAKSKLAAFSTFVIAEIEKVGKSAGNRETTEEEAIQALKKLHLKAVDALKGYTETCIAGSVGEVNLQEIQLRAEVSFLEEFLPKMVSQETVKDFLNNEFAGTSPSKGEVMKALKDKFGALVDMKQASVSYAEIFGRN